MKHNYVDNEKFLEVIVEYKKRCSEASENDFPKPRIPEYAGECILKIAENIAKLPNFSKYTFKEEMIGDAVENSLMYFNNFDEVKYKKPFAYFTLVIIRAFIRRIDKEKTKLYMKYKKIQQSGILDEDCLYIDEDGRMKQFEVYENITEFIQNFEESRRKKKEKKSKKKKGLELFFEEDDQ